MDRVAELLRSWGRDLGLEPRDLARWTALAYLHDALREAPAEEVRPTVEPAFRDLPPKVLHGPAAAARLRREGVTDELLLRAVAFHTLGHPELDTMGRALYAADFLEPGRSVRPEWRAGLRARMPDELDQVVREILEARIRHVLERESSVRPETTAFLERLETLTEAAG